MAMKKEYLIGGLLGVVLCGLVAYAVMTFIGMEDSETAQQPVLRLPQPLPSEVSPPEIRLRANEERTGQGKAKEATQVQALSGSQKADERKTDTLTGVRITLKNGRSIIADSCRDVSGKLLCIVSGGSMQIDRQEIATIRDVKLQGISSNDQAGEPSDGKAENGKAEDKASPGAKGAQPNDGKMVRVLTAEQIKRLDHITARKAVLQPERERLIKEREQLHQDAKDMGMIYKQEQFDGIKKRIEDVEEKINRFNEEVKQLNSEENSIIEAQNKRK